ncbi:MULTISPECIES: type 2 periplasmic-binding domain-containing protein [Streptomyces]|uniref:hypothetical protein n=1 Tax=Streptomyces TaxID=1883 RepID=UPI0029B408CC|nr:MULTISPECIES: hypothetical protein [Streptomyces]MDX2552749.1 hypothetical protein [Streptomyces stelliscabiei]MDX3777732.1 hypothetical protein [Streptomyces europaeiscabiei]
MKVTYTPEDGEPQVFDYNPNKLMSVEREALERVTGRPFSDFAMGVLKGHGLCRRALLHVLLKRQHPTLRLDDVDFAWDELTVEMTQGEIDLAVARLREKGGDEQMIDAMLKQRETAPEDEGKARLPFAV